MTQIENLIDKLGWANLSNESKAIFKLMNEAIDSALLEAPIDDILYGRKNGAWTEVPAATASGVQTVSGSAVDNTDPLNPVIDLPSGGGTLQETIDAGGTYTTPDGTSFLLDFSKPVPGNDNIVYYNQANNNTKISQQGNNLIITNAYSASGLTPQIRSRLFLGGGAVQLNSYPDTGTEGYTPANTFTMNEFGAFSFVCTTAGVSSSTYNLLANAHLFRANYPTSGDPTVGADYTQVQFGGTGKNGLYITTKYVSNLHPNGVRIKADTIAAVERVVQAPDAAGTMGIINTNAPASATAAGVVGEIRVTDTFIYTCTAPNTWVRAAVATW